MYLPIYVPFFKIFKRSVEPCPWQATTQFIKFEPVPIYLELSFYSVCKISSMFDGNTWSKIIFKNTKLFIAFEKVWTKNALSLNSWAYKTYIDIRLKNGYNPGRVTWLKDCGEDLGFKARCSHNTKIQKGQNQKKSSLSWKPEKAT